MSMMNEKARNTIVGVTILIALVLLTWGAFLLGRLPAVGPYAPYTLTLRARSANGLTYGDVVDLNGVIIGSVRNVMLSGNLQAAKVILGVYSNVSLPTNTKALIAAPTVGSSYVSMYIPLPAAPTSLPKNGTAVLPASLAPSGFIPPSLVNDFSSIKDRFNKLSKRLDRVADDLHVLLRPVMLNQQQRKGKAKTAAGMNNLSALIQRLNTTMNSFNRLLADRTLRTQVRQIVANVASSSQELKTTLQSFQATATHFNGVLDKAGAAAVDINQIAKTTNARIISLSLKLTRILENVNDIATSINQGHGTVGRFVKDPRLYNALLDLTHRLNRTVDDVHALVKQVRAEGFDVHVGF